MAGQLWRSAFVVNVATVAQVAGYGRIDPALIVAQSVLETGWFTSPVFREGNNAFGLRLPRIRPTTAIGTFQGHAAYNSLADCVHDYFLRQRYFGISNGPLYVDDTIRSGYATDPRYRLKWLDLYADRAGMPDFATLAVPIVTAWIR
jgi:flagellum-specific peptidoglycan hydrolase FlgJ